MSQPIQLLRWREQGHVHLGLSHDYHTGVLPISQLVEEVHDIPELTAYCRAQNTDISAWAQAVLDKSSQRVLISDEQVILPIDLSELWASEATYEISRDARRDETTISDNLYERVYLASRPELFFKAPQRRIVGPRDFVGIRRDATWHVPEPELTVILDDQGQLFGLTVGNDMTARDLEAHNPLYLPQAKIFHNSAAIGPTVVLADTIDPYHLTIHLMIARRGDVVVNQTTTTTRLRRSIEDLITFLKNEWPVAPWTGLMTGTGIVPPDYFAVEEGDEISIEIPGIGALINFVRRIDSDWAQVPGGRTRVLQINPQDTVAVALGALEPGQEVMVGTTAVMVQDPIPFGHKLAITPMRPGDWVIKYGERIGMATTNIEMGQHVHVHNVDSYRGRGDLLKKEGRENEQASS
ncbi:MAG: fumarylacetoacetate hydrolase family protein [Firmicutes bacterium]|nr:fumarylacetoacetate hydrolase family protein [Bacillota bacterium]